MVNLCCMSRVFIVAAVLLSTACGAARADGPVAATTPLLATATVRHYFDAFSRLDAAELARMTSGAAAIETRRMVEELRAEARRHGVEIKLRLADLHLAPPDANAPSRVEASFKMEVVAKKSIFSMVARKLTGRASFDVSADTYSTADATRGRIVGIVVHFY